MDRKINKVMKNLLFLIKKGQGNMDRVDLKYQ